MRVDRGGRNEGVGALAEALLQEGEGNGAAAVAERLPDARAGDEGGGLFPEPRLAEHWIEKAVRDHAVSGGRQTGAERGLRRAGDGGKNGTERLRTEAADGVRAVLDGEVVA